MAYRGHDNQLAFWPYSFGHIWGRQPLVWSWFGVDFSAPGFLTWFLDLFPDYLHLQHSEVEFCRAFINLGHPACSLKKLHNVI